jgi:hypothetical protein
MQIHLVISVVSGVIDEVLAFHDEAKANEIYRQHIADEMNLATVPTNGKDLAQLEQDWDDEAASSETNIIFISIEIQ